MINEFKIITYYSPRHLALVSDYPAPISIQKATTSHTMDGVDDSLSLVKNFRSSKLFILTVVNLAVFSQYIPG